MPILPEIVEKPGGARNVIQYDVHIERDIPQPGNPYPPRYYIEVKVQFEDEQSADEFEKKIRDMMPEYK